MIFACMLFSIVHVLDVWGAKEGTSVWSTKELSRDFMWTVSLEVGDLYLLLHNFDIWFRFSRLCTILAGLMRPLQFEHLALCLCFLYNNKLFH